MDFDRNIFDLCSFCEENIDKFAVTCYNSNCKFCDLVCAKLYYDNVEKIKINIKEYNQLYINNQLSNQDKNMFEKLSMTSFYMFPIYKLDEYADKKEAKKLYSKSILMMKK